MKILILFFLISAETQAHSGRTDSSGCHHDFKNGGYHCHRSDKSIVKKGRLPASKIRESKKSKKVGLINSK